MNKITSTPQKFVDMTIKKINSGSEKLIGLITEDSGIEGMTNITLMFSDGNIKLKKVDMTSTEKLMNIISIFEPLADMLDADYEFCWMENELCLLKRKNSTISEFVKEYYKYKYRSGYA